MNLEKIITLLELTADEEIRKAQHLENHALDTLHQCINEEKMRAYREAAARNSAMRRMAAELIKVVKTTR